ncbi:MAG: DNA-processing protein DprA [Bacteroidota bacterium]
MNDLLYKIALTLIPGVGSVNGKSLVAYCGGVQAVFMEKKHSLLRIPGIGEQTVNAITNHNVFARAEEELRFIEKNAIQPIFYLDKQYPLRLKQCHDSPLMLYYKGTADLNASKVVALVGTRSATEYGRDMCRKIVEGLIRHNALIVSGLAYGIDTWSHKAALDSGLETVAVLGHGLDRVYPYANRSLAEKITENGGLLCEYMSNTLPDRENFPMRNRIIAGISDAVVVIEAGERGGALITAEIANSYNRDVFAVPGRLGDPHSEGCNKLIKINKAALIQSAKDISYILNWDDKQLPKVPVQGQLFLNLSPDEELILKLLREKGDMDIDLLRIESGFLPAKAATVLLNLEFEGLIRCMPGKVYRLI